MIASGLGALLFVYFLLMRTLRRHVARRLKRIAFAAATVGLVCLVFSFAVHLALGHAPGSPEPMAITGFVIHHKAYWLVGAFIVLAYLGPALVETA